MNTLKVGILGLTGRMGNMIRIALGDHPEMKLIGGTSRTPLPENLAHLISKPIDLFRQADVLIDFTTHTTVLEHAELARDHKKPLVMGTTGLSQTDYHHLEQAANDIPCLYAPNMSLGVNLLLHLIEQTSAALDEHFDIEINETHHRHKKDSPSGTALAMGKAAAKGRNQNFETVKHLHWVSPITRKKGDIGFSVQRGGEVIGDHKISFFGDDEIVELAHRGQNRMIYAKGAVRAALWLVKQNPGLYSMRDVLGLNGE